MVEVIVIGVVMMVLMAVCVNGVIRFMRLPMVIKRMVVFGLMIVL